MATVQLEQETIDRAIRISGASTWDPMYQDIRGRVHTGWASITETTIFTDLNRTQALRILDADPYEFLRVESVSAPVPKTSTVCVPRSGAAA